MKALRSQIMEQLGDDADAYDVTIHEVDDWLNEWYNTYYMSETHTIPLEYINPTAVLKDHCDIEQKLYIVSEVKEFIFKITEVEDYDDLESDGYVGISDRNDTKKVRFSSNDLYIVRIEKKLGY